MKRLLYLVTFLLISDGSIASESCTSTFDNFLEVFQNNQAFQASHIRYPLSYSFVDTNAEPEPKTVKQRLSKRNYLKLPGSHYPSKSVEQKMGLVRKVTEDTKGTVLVRFDKPDSDVFTVEYKFAIHNGCWQLIETNNQSL